MKEIDKKINELKEYVRLEGTELGEACSYLISLINYPDYISNELMCSLDDEVSWQLKNFKENSMIVEKIYPAQKYKELEWIY